MAAKAKTKGTAIDFPEMEMTTEEEIEALKKANEFKLSPHLVNLLLHEPFFSTLLRKVSKVRSMNIPTAGVTVRDSDFVMFWNPVFVSNLETIQVRGLLKHECYHLIFKHCTSRKQEPHMLWNMATDLAINSLIDVRELPEKGLIPGQPLDLSHIKDQETKQKWQKVSDLIESLPKNKSSEWYMHELQQDEDVKNAIEDMSKDSQGGSGGFQMDDHDGWGDMSEEDRLVAEGKLKQALSEAVNKCDRNGQWGSVGSSMRTTLRAMVNDTIDWKKILHSFCGRSQRANKARTHKRVNRKYPYIHPGVKRGHSASVAIYIDQSGSVGNEELEMFFGALNQLGKMTNFTLFPFDYSVDDDNAVKWKRGQKHLPTRTRCGGTSFHSVEEHIRKTLRSLMAISFLQTARLLIQVLADNADAGLFFRAASCTSSLTQMMC